MTLSHAADVVGNALASAGAAGVAVFVAVVAAVAQVPAPVVPEQFWPQSVVTWIAVVGFAGQAVHWCYRWWRRTQEPTHIRETEWRAGILKRLDDCELSHEQARETTGAIRELRQTMERINRTIDDRDREWQQHRQEFARMQGRLEWDRVTERRHGERRHPDEHGDRRDHSRD